MANKIQFNKDYPEIKNSLEIFKRSEGLIPASTQTLVICFT